MADTAIDCENLGKRYLIRHQAGQASYRRFSEDLVAAVARPFRRKAAEQRERANREWFWALKDVSFQVKRGEVLGIIGRNGAGKSTLLKVLSRITEPTEGLVRIRGRVASLLEVGTGFHPELTGRENIFLNGTILGMTRREIQRKFDEIVAFAEVEKFLDTPVKRYSSGMYVRLAFAVAAHLEPEILIVDEVLAVGDIQFQKKCLGKMQDVSRTEGRTVLFVSHNMGTISNLCPHVLLLEDGRVRTFGRTNAVVAEYIRAGASSLGERTWGANEPAAAGAGYYLGRVATIARGTITSEVEIDKPVAIQMDVAVTGDDVNLVPSFHVFDKQGSWAFCGGPPTSCNLARGSYRYECVIPGNLLNDGLYTVNILLLRNGQIEVNVTDAISFTVHETGFGRVEFGGVVNGCVRPGLGWKMGRLSSDGAVDGIKEWPAALGTVRG